MCVCRNVVSEPLTLKLQIKSSYIRSPWNLVPSSGLTSCHSADNIRWKVVGHRRLVVRQCGLERHSRYEHSVNEALQFTKRKHFIAYQRRWGAATSGWRRGVLL